MYTQHWFEWAMCCRLELEDGKYICVCVCIYLSKHRCESVKWQWNWKTHTHTVCSHTFVGVMEMAFRFRESNDCWAHTQHSFDMHVLSVGKKIATSHPTQLSGICSYNPKFRSLVRCTPIIPSNRNQSSSKCGVVVVVVFAVVLLPFEPCTVSVIWSMFTLL